MIKTKTGVELRKIPLSISDDYRAGSDGEIYSKKKYKGWGQSEVVDWRMLTGHSSNTPYRCISMSHKNIKKTKSVHRLVCLAFHGLPPTSSHQVRHLDGNPRNNLPDNLKWGTQEENWLDRKAHGRGIDGEKHHASKLTNIERGHIKWAVKKGLCSGNHAARILGMSSNAISAVCRSSH